MTRFIVLTIFIAVLAGCAASNPGEMPAATAAAPAAGSLAPANAANPPATPAAAREEEAPAPRPERHEAAAQCWMKYDKSGGSLEAKAKLVDKCIDEKMRGGPATAAAAPKPKR